MDRRSVIKSTGIAGVLAAGIAPAVHAQAAIRWRLASSFPKSLDTIFGAAEVFSDRVKAMSGGKFEVSVHAAGELMPAFGVVDGVQQGTVEAAHTGACVEIDNRRIAQVAKLAGAPRAASAGVELHVRIGERVAKSTPLYTVHAEARGELEYALEYAAQRAEIVRIEER